MSWRRGWLEITTRDAHMSVSSEPANCLRELDQALADLSGMPRRVQVRHVLPLVDKLHGYGFTFADIAQRTNEVGLSFQPDSLKLAVHRWRKKQIVTAGSEVRGAKMFRDASTLVGGGDNSRNQNQLGSELSVAAALTKARLQEIREEHIDLDEIKRRARQSRSRDQGSGQHPPPKN